MRTPPSPLEIDYSTRTGRSRKPGHRVLVGAVVATALLTYFLLRAPEAVSPSGPLQAKAVPEEGIAEAGAALASGEQLTAGSGPQLPESLQAGEDFEYLHVVIKRNDTLDRIFRQNKLSIADLARLRNLTDVREALDFLRPGDALTISHRDGEVQRLVRKLNDVQTLTVARQPEGFTARVLENPLESTVERRQGSITSSLFLAAGEAGLSDQTTMVLANIFGWDIDFVLDIRSGDAFTVVYEKLWQDGELLRDGNILAAEFVNNGRTFRAVRYERADGAAEYFTPEGRSMRKAFLRAPLEFSRVSSNFNPNRRHPILNTIRAHKGVDYAAPHGTPVRAAGDGRVQSRGWNGGYGNAIILEHGGGITTLYGHLSKFARGLKQGQRVKQGELIGYVGKTGLASGPHLHYEYRLNGVHRNPRTVKLPDADPIAPELLADFRKRTAPLLAKLDRGDKDSLLAQN